MTNEQRLLCYLYSVDSIQRRQLVIALSDMPYQSVTLTVRNAVKHGYVEVFRKDESNHLRITPDGVKYIRSTARDALDGQKRATMKRRLKGENGRRLNRMEVVSCMCRAAGIKLAKEEHIRLENVLNADADDYARFMDDYFYDKGLLFLSDELSATIKAEQTVGEEYTTGMSRLVGVIVNCKGIFYVYCTLDRLMRWIISYERRRVAAIDRRVEAIAETRDMAVAIAKEYIPEDLEVRYEDEWVRLNMVMTPPFNIGERQFNYSLAAAIWMLDAIRANHKMDEALALLPKDEEQLASIELPSCVSPCYSFYAAQSTHAVTQRGVESRGIQLFPWV